MYRLAKTDRRANSSFKKYIYIYYLIYIYIFIYKYSPGWARVCSLFLKNDLFLFHSLARSVFDWLRFQSGSLWDTSFSNFCLRYVAQYDTNSHFLLHHFASLFTFYLQRRNENLRVTSLVLFLFRQVLRFIWQWFSVADSLCYSLVKKYPKKRLELRFKCSDTGESVRQSVDEVPWPDDGSETGSSDVLQDPWDELGDPRAHPW